MLLNGRLNRFFNEITARHRTVPCPFVCGCESGQRNSSSQLSAENYSDLQSYEVELTQYKGKEEYQTQSLGVSQLFQNGKYYYYVDEFGFFALDKQTKKQTVLSEEYLSSMYVFADKIYFNKIGEIIVFDTKTHKFEEKSYKERALKKVCLSFMKNTPFSVPFIFEAFRGFH